MFVHENVTNIIYGKTLNTVTSLHIQNKDMCIVHSVDRDMIMKTTAAQNGVALSYPKVRGLYFLAVVFVRRIVVSVLAKNTCAQFPHNSQTFLM